jgi:alpha-N-arabinofuranosidase
VTRIAIDPSRPVGRLDRKVFGGFVEHLGRCIYGGLYEEGSPLSAEEYVREATRWARRSGCSTRGPSWSAAG